MPVLLTNDFGVGDFDLLLVEHQALELLKLVKKEPYEISILLTNDSSIQAINATWRDKDKPTNVLSFPMDDEADSICPMLGDIIISIDTAKREALTKNHPLQNYLTRLLIHGFVHLLGYDHEESDEAYAEMTAIETDYLQNLGEL